jgi:hypothetical protein
VEVETGRNEVGSRAGKEEGVAKMSKRSELKTLARLPTRRVKGRVKGKKGTRARRKFGRKLQGSPTTEGEVASSLNGDGVVLVDDASCRRSDPMKRCQSWAR